MPDRPRIIVLTGPNGAGKSTVARVVLPESLGVTQFVNGWAQIQDRTS
jgi:ABC-type Mn2+/Zn2+ transport system ATPase subunit